MQHTTRHLILKQLLVSTAMTSALVLSAITPAHALPAGGSVAGGSATIGGSGTVMDINQTSQRALINWQNFDVGGGERVNFNQPNSSSVTLNRVTGSASASQINGMISANGTVMIINPHGVMFGQGAQVNVGNLVATTSDIDDDRFMNGDYTFNHPGNPNATISNAGHIILADGGLAALVGPNVTNSGLIQARLGKVQMGSGDSFTIDLYGDGLINLKAGGAITSQLVSNSGTISADGGSVLLTAAAAQNTINSLINMDGIVEANSVGEVNGHIMIYAEGSNAVVDNIPENKGGQNGESTALIRGTLRAAGSKRGEKGGRIDVLADDVGILSGATLDASGDAGGGTIRVGGDYHGEGLTPTASKVIVQSGTLINADAIDSGNGGHVTVWADDWTNFAGDITAKGGATSGNGGFVETSGKQSLTMLGNVNASSPHGNAGTWLMDPDDLVVNGSADTNAGSTPDWLAGAGGGNVLNTNINAALNSGTDVTLTASGNITISAAITQSTSPDDNTLSMFAGGDIVVNAAITSSSNKLNILLNADRDANNDGYINIAANITSNGGYITLGGGSGAISAGVGYAYGNAGQASGININAATLDSGAGNIIMNGNGYTGGVNTGHAYGIYMQGGAKAQTSGAANTGTISLNGIGGGTGSGDNNQGVRVESGGNQISVINGNMSITGTGGSGSGDGSVGVAVDSGATIQTTGTGTITMTGYGGGTGTSSYDGGVAINGTVQSTIVGGGSITLIGYSGDSGGTGGTVNYNASSGVSTYNGTISSAGGAIVLDGNTGNGHPLSTSTGDGYYGVAVVAGSSITATGTATITINGNGINTSTGFNNYGVLIDNSTVSAVSGAISVTGNAGAGTADGNTGVYIFDSGAIKTTGIGNISVTGTGNGTFANSVGVYVNSVNGIQATGSGNITVVGQGSLSGANWNNNGVQVSNGSISAAGGDISVTGTGGTGTMGIFNGFNYGQNGVFVADGSVSTTGNGAVTVIGTGGGNAGSTDNHGVVVRPSGSIATVNGTLTVTGTGSNSSGSNNYGVYVTGASAVIGATGTGAVNISGTAQGNGNSATDYGVFVEAAGVISAVNNTLTVTGQGGGAGTGGDNYGVYVTGANSTIKTTGSGNATVTGIGVGGSASLYITSATTSGIQTTGSGDITIIVDKLSLHEVNDLNSIGNLTVHQYTNGTTIGVGTGAGTLAFDDTTLGYMSWGAGHTLTIGDNNAGAMDIDTAVTFTKAAQFTSGGTITLDGALTGTGSGSFAFTGATTLKNNITTANQAITFNSAVTLGTNSTLDAGSGTMTFGSTVNGAHNLTANAGTFSFGGAIGGGTPLSAVSLTSVNGMTLPSITAASIFARTTGAAADMTIAAGKTLTASGAGDALTLVSGRNFINNAGSGALVTPSGRWLVYSINPVYDTMGSLSYDFRTFGCTYGGACPAFPGSGRGFLYSDAADLAPQGATNGTTRSPRIAGAIQQANDLIKPASLINFDMWRLYYEWSHITGGTIVVPVVDYNVPESSSKLVGDESPAAGGSDRMAQGMNHSGLGGPYISTPAPTSVTIRCSYTSNLSVRGAGPETPAILSVCND